MTLPLILLLPGIASGFGVQNDMFFFQNIITLASLVHDDVTFLHIFTPMDLI